MIVVSEYDSMGMIVVSEYDSSGGYDSSEYSGLIVFEVE